MARRRTQEDEGSLELLLDTVCNAFGGIIFITLLVCMLPTREAQEERRGARASAEEESELEALKRSVAQKLAMLDVLKETSGRLGYENLGPELSKLARLRDRESELRELAELRSKEQREVEKRVKDAELQVGQLEQLLERLKMAFLQVEKDNRDLAEVRSTRLPRLRKVSKNNYFIVLYQQRVYLIRRPGAYTLQTDYNDEDFDVSRMGIGWLFRPLSTKGTPANEWLDSPRGAKRVLSQVARSDYLVFIIVYPDSLAPFADIRNAFTGQGYDYNWSPVAAGNPIGIVPASGPMDVQTPN